MFDLLTSLDRKSAKKIDYWRKNFNSVSPYLDLHTDRPRSQTSKSIKLTAELKNSYSLTKKETNVLQQLAIDNNVDLSDVLFCAWQGFYSIATLSNQI